MDFGAIISRAIKITWKYKVLWILGFLTALGSGGGGSGGGGGSVNFPTGQPFGNGASRGGGELPPWVQGIIQRPEPLLTALGALVCVLFIIGFIFAIVSIIARAGLIAGVQQIETEGSIGLGRAWKAGAARFWPMLGLEILLGIPVLILIIIFVIIFVAMFGSTIMAIVATNGGGLRASNVTGMLGMMAGGFAVVCCLVFVAGLYGLLTMALTTMGERAIVLENTGVIASIRRGWSILRANLGNIIVLALLMAVISFVFGMVSGAIGFALVAPTMLPMFLAFINGAQPGAGTIALAAGGVIVAIIIGSIVNAVYITFNSTAWTLAFRQFTGIAPALSAPPPATPSLPTA